MTTSLPATYRPFDSADKAHAYLHLDDRWSPKESIAQRLKTAAADLNKLRNCPRKTEPHRTQWLAQIARLEALIRHLS